MPDNHLIRLLLIAVFFAITMLLYSCITSDAAQITTFTMSDHKQAISIKGRLEPPDVQAFALAVDSMHAKGRPYEDITVWLDSLGGNTAAISIGNYIHTNGLQTYVGPHTACYSLCAYIWLAGRVRYVNSTASVKWHRASHINADEHVLETPDDKVTDLIIGNGYLALYLGRIGMSYNAVDKLLTRELTTLTPQLAEELGLAYTIVKTEGK